MTVDEWVERVLAQAPPLSDEQRTRLAELLRPVRNAKRHNGAATNVAPARGDAA